MQIILEKLKKVVLYLEKERGPMSVFALFLRIDPLEKWDIVVSAPWLNPNDIASYNLVTSRIQEVLDTAEIMQLARIVILDETDPVVSFLKNSATVTNGHFGEVSGEIFTEKFGFTIKKAYLLRCQKINPKEKDQI